MEVSASVDRVVAILRGDRDLDNGALRARGFSTSTIEEARRITGIRAPTFGGRRLVQQLADAKPETYVCRRPHPWKR